MSEEITCGCGQPAIMDKSFDRQGREVFRCICTCWMVDYFYSPKDAIAAFRKATRADEVEELRFLLTAHKIANRAYEVINKEYIAEIAALKARIKELEGSNAKVAPWIEWTGVNSFVLLKTNSKPKCLWCNHGISGIEPWFCEKHYAQLKELEANQ